MIDSIYSRQWLPAEVNQIGSSSVGDSQRFLLAVPNASSTSTISLGQLKSEIAGIKQEVDAGDGSEAYRNCIAYKYEWEREVDQVLIGRSATPYIGLEASVLSGQPNGSHVFEDPFSKDWRGGDPNKRVQFWIEGGDSALFDAMWPGIVTSDRPLPAGSYRFYILNRLHKAIICDAYPEQLRKSSELFVMVTAPSGVLHELFFDPVTVGTTVAADDTNGVLKPTSFTASDGSSASIERISYESSSPGTGQGGTVKIEVDPVDALSGQIVDVIELDGTVSLSLNTGDATVDETNDTLSWAVSSAPWEDGDLLMVRMRRAPP